MLYRNFTKEPQWMVVGMVKTRVKPGGIVNLNYADLSMAGSNIRQFESVSAEVAFAKERLADLPKEDVVPEPAPATVEE